MSVEHKNFHTQICDAHSAYMYTAHTSLSYTYISIQPAGKPEEHLINSYKLLFLISEKDTETINIYKDQEGGGGTNEEEYASFALTVGKSGGLGGTEWV